MRSRQAKAKSAASPAAGSSCDRVFLASRAMTLAATSAWHVSDCVQSSAGAGGGGDNVLVCTSGAPMLIFKWTGRQQLGSNSAKSGEEGVLSCPCVMVVSASVAWLDMRKAGKAAAYDRHRLLDRRPELMLSLPALSQTCLKTSLAKSITSYT